VGLLVPAGLLLVVVGLGVAGRIGAGPTPEPPTALSALTPAAEVPADRPSSGPSAPGPIAVAKPRRQKGTDGFLPALPFDVPPEPMPPRVDRFTIDDVRPGWSGLDTTPPWVRRLRGLGSYTADPYQR
jgi:hypothetical protein